MQRDPMLLPGAAPSHIRALQSLPDQQDRAGDPDRSKAECSDVEILEDAGDQDQPGREQRQAGDDRRGERLVEGRLTRGIGRRPGRGARTVPRLAALVARRSSVFVRLVRKLRAAGLTT